MKLDWTVNGMTGTAEWNGVVHIHGPFSGTVKEAKAVVKIAPPEGMVFNGYQSWTYTPEWLPAQRMYGTGHLPQNLLNTFSLDRYGDAFFAKYSFLRGRFHGYSTFDNSRSTFFILVHSLSSDTVDKLTVSPTLVTFEI